MFMMSPEQNGNNQDGIQDGDRNEAPSANFPLDPTHLATPIGKIVDQKLKNFMPTLTSARRKRMSIL